MDIFQYLLWYNDLTRKAITPKKYWSETGPKAFWNAPGECIQNPSPEQGGLFIDEWDEVDRVEETLLDVPHGPAALVALQHEEVVQPLRDRFIHEDGGAGAIQIQCCQVQHHRLVRPATGAWNGVKRGEEA